MRATCHSLTTPPVIESWSRGVATLTSGVWLCAPQCSQHVDTPLNEWWYVLLFWNCSFLRELHCCADANCWFPSRTCVNEVVQLDSTEPHFVFHLIFEHYFLNKSSAVFQGACASAQIPSCVWCCDYVMAQTLETHWWCCASLPDFQVAVLCDVWSSFWSCASARL